MKKVVVVLIVAFLVFYVMNSPNQAANMVHGTWHVTVNVAHGAGGFLNKLAS